MLQMDKKRLLMSKTSSLMTSAIIQNIQKWMIMELTMSEMIQ